jgi:hypothetical protein
MNAMDLPNDIVLEDVNGFGLLHVYTGEPQS